MKKNYYFILFFSIIYLNCSGIRVFEKKDNLGRITHVSYYDGNTLKKDEEIRYYGNSHNPSQIIYKMKSGLDLVPYKEEIYQFNNNNLTKLSFNIYKNNKKINTGRIIYHYLNDKHSRIEYYSFIESLKKMFIFGLDQYNYRNNELISRRIIEYDINTVNNQPMQISHYVITYNNEQVESMKITILDKKTKKIIDNNVKNVDLIVEKIENIEDYYIRRTRGKEFLMK